MSPTSAKVADHISVLQFHGELCNFVYFSLAMLPAVFQSHG